MTHVKQIIGNGLIVAGMLGTVHGVLELIKASSLDKEFQQKSILTEQISKKYGVVPECADAGIESGLFVPYCKDLVPNAKTPEEEKSVLDAYNQELEAKLNTIPPNDPVVNEIGFRGVGEFFGGPITAAVGTSLRRRKEG